MVYWCTLIGITLRRSISQHHLVDITLPQLHSMHMCKLSIQTLSTYVGELMLPFGVHETCPYSFTHGKYAWTSNVDSIKSQFISLCKGCHQLQKMERLKALVWFWLINETLSGSNFSPYICAKNLDCSLHICLDRKCRSQCLPYDAKV